MAGGSRFQEKQQKRRQNGVLNIAIAIVLLAVIVVAYQIFFTSDTTEQASSKENKASQQTTKDNKTEKTKEKEEAKKQEQAEAKKKAEEEKQKAEEAAKANEKVPAEKTQPKATDAYTKPSWKPVGTTQGTTPAMTFQKGSADWNEMNQAIASAIEVPVDQLIIHRIGNNGKNKAYGNVQDKQTGKKYYVNIDWVDNEGWKPTLVQTLN
ncbi:FMN-dependent NADH-azoreductase [Bacillus pseudomycoides]|uniref:FMN-dependent NADH-azoreductase n=1 Tax=Bacillus pseudomycoides TaxID=64104 RepID=A0AA91ZUZ4_9BACI|nr:MULTISPECIES: YrrS family protein [Bacillus]PEB53457.1 FMN-dependent NADH-azoreductase [Bacillus sp. AFS098217]PED84566.1 FMN-dependent NADH-azoreductase [Bacillus pseudomycoides]PEU14856.1 FMN-dependent NADH-azoreductase [Bacillus sp. AFS019443]PEU19391.1 FMN-dependent NADH-azoreductase [Bacillus sp. AFS014408]PFW64528.1 FMN-dependent NADH-azoreductase [Bacillus sp. AFS075034]